MSYDSDDMYFQEFIEDFIGNKDISSHETTPKHQITYDIDQLVSNDLGYYNKPLYRPSIDWNDDLIEYHHKRSYDDEYHEEDSESSCNTPEKPISISFLSFKESINQLYAAFNQGNISKLTCITEKFIDPKCIVRINKPFHEINDIGPMSLIKTNQALINSHPDGVVTVHKSTTSYANGQYTVRSSLRFRGTQLYSEYMANVNLPVKLTTLLSFFDQSKMSEKKIAEFQQLEKDMIEKGEVPMMFVKVSSTMIFDEFTNRAKFYGNRVRLSSFRPVNPKDV